MSRPLQKELVEFLSDLYSVEQQALAQLGTAPESAGNPALAEIYRRHFHETEHHADLVRERLEAHGGSPSAIKDAIMKLGGKGFLLFARTLAETPGRLAVHSYAYEAMEWAGYQMLKHLAQRADDAPTLAVAEEIAAEERAMLERLAEGFDAAEAVSHRDLEADDLSHHVRKHLAEVHAFEKQAIALLAKGEKLAGHAGLVSLYHRHHEESERHAALLEQRLDALGSERSLLQDAAMALGALNWGFFFQAQADTSIKLAAFAYAFEHLEIASYELLQRTATRAGDRETARLCERILDEERAMAEALVAHFSLAVNATIDAPD